MTAPTVIPQRTSVAVGELGFAPTNAGELMTMAKFIADSELKPAGIKTAADAFLVMAVGMSWGFDPIMALQTLHVVKGKVGLPGETCAALIQSHPKCADYRWGFEGQGDERVAWIQTVRAGRPAPNPRSTFSVADAKRAGLWNSKTRNGEPTPWCTYPEDMLLWKATAREKRRNWPDVYPGLRVTEDLEHLPEPEPERDITPRKPEPDPLLDAGVEAHDAADPLQSDTGKSEPESSGAPQSGGGPAAESSVSEPEHPATTSTGGEAVADPSDAPVSGSSSTSSNTSSKRPGPSDGPAAPVELVLDARGCCVHCGRHQNFLDEGKGHGMRLDDGTKPCPLKVSP